MRSADKTGARDAWAVAYLKLHSGLASDMGGYRPAMTAVKTFWTTLDGGFQRAWYKHWAVPQQACPEFPSLEAFRAWSISRCGPLVAYDPVFAGCQSEAAPSSEQDGEFAGESRVHGYILTWNGRWGARREDVARLMNLQSIPLAAIVELVRASPFYQRLWAEFKEFAAHVCEMLHWPKKSGTMEISFKRKNAENLVHFHLAVTDADRRHRLREAATDKTWVFLGSRPQVRPTQGKGRHLHKALSNAHYYVQAPKYGTAFTFTNHAAFGPLLVEPGFVYELWRKRKMSHEVCIDQLMMSRGRGCRGYVADVEYNLKWERAKAQAAQKVVLEALIQWKPNKELAVVLEWVQMHRAKFGTATRFKFLVLNGPSRFGKTSYAKNVFGPDVTLVLSCQGALQPALDRLEPHHRCIVCDEANHEMVCRNKQVFQAGLDQVQLGQSQCNQHAYTAFVYAMPIIVCTNDWLVGATRDQADWCHANSVLVQVDEPMWRDELPLADA